MSSRTSKSTSTSSSEEQRPGRRPKIDAVISKECWIKKCIVRVDKPNADSPMRLLFYSWPFAEELLGDYFYLKKHGWHIEYSERVIQNLESLDER